MKTISAINTILREYELRLERSVSTTAEEYKEDVRLAQEDVVDKFKKLRQILPELVQVNYDSEVSSSEIATIKKNLVSRVEEKFVADLIPTGETMKRNVCGTDFEIPVYAQWQSDPSNANFVINYDKASLDKAVKAFNCLLSNIILSLPIKSVHLNFVDLQLSGTASLFTRNLDHSLYRDLIADTGQLDSLCKDMQSRMVTVLQECGELAKYNAKNQGFRYPYEIVVLLHYPNNFERVSDSLIPLFQNGYKGGIYFVVLNDKDAQVSGIGRSVLSLKDHYYEIDLDKITSESKSLVHVTSLLDNKTISGALFDYINTEASKESKVVPIKQDYERLFATPYASTDSLIEVPVGKTLNGGVSTFQMDSVSHVHSFILGQSGSGKSVFLHNVISAAMLKYSPEDLQFYLLDFKMGGVEFNRYRNSKHVKALLVDNSDIQITLEILRDLHEAMKERGKALRSIGVSNIADYNRKNPSNHMPQIMLVADECHAMFVRNQQDSKKFDEISEIVAKIAKEGRNQGVHLLLATQTLAQAEISNEILNNITDHYLLKCASSDSEKMVNGSSDKTASLTTGQVYYHHVSGEELFQSFYTSNDEVKQVVDYIGRKAEGSRSNGQFYFNGSDNFTVDKETLGSIQANKYPVSCLGYSVSLKRESVSVPIKKDDGENILFFGINDEAQVSQTVVNALVTAMHTASELGKPKAVKVIDLMDFDNEPRYVETLSVLKERGLIETVKRRDIGRVLYDLASSIDSDNVAPTILVILGQERIRGLKLDLKIEDVDATSGGGMSFDFDNLDSISFDKPQVNTRYDSYRKALAYILTNGPHVGVNTFLQIDQPSKLLYDDYVSARFVYSTFNHIVMFRSDSNAANILQLDDDIRIENLSSDPERLRAYCYYVEKDKYQMFCPFTDIDTDSIQ